MNKKLKRLMWHLQRTGVYEMQYTCPSCGHTHELESTPSKKAKPTEQEREMFETFRIKYRGKKRGLDTELDNLMKHKDWQKVIKELYANTYYKGEDIRYIPHLQTFINQRRWEMFADEPVKQTNPYGQQHNWRTS